MRLACVLWVVALVGCDVQPADIPFPEPNDLGARLFADTVIGLTKGGSVTSCNNALGACGGAPTGTSSTAPGCTGNPALGPNDGKGYALGPNDRLEVAFRCGQVLDRTVNGNPAPDLKIWATLTGSASAVIEVRKDEAEYRTLGVLAGSTNSFDLTRIPTDLARYVRITAGGLGGVEIDAVEAL